jgi:DNA repair photolyase
LYGLDLTAGCGHGCLFCHIRGSARYPGDRRLLFDPATTERVRLALDRLSVPPRRIVLSPHSDPLPPDRDVRAEALRILDLLRDRAIPVLVMTRGRISRPFVSCLSRNPGLARVAVGWITMNRRLSRALEPAAAPPDARLRGLTRLVEAGVPVEARLEPLIPGLTDTRDNVMPLLERLARAGVREVVVHYLFLHPSMTDSLMAGLSEFGRAEQVTDEFEGGPAFSLGTLGQTKHLPLETRRQGLARLLAWGAEFGLQVRTGHSQNPDFPQIPVIDKAPSASMGSKGGRVGQGREGFFRSARSVTSST